MSRTKNYEKESFLHKLKILFALLLLVVVLPAFAAISDKTGLKTTFSVMVNSKPYAIETVANFDVRNVSFEDDTLIFTINSSLENNLVELQIPNEITKGELKFILDDAQIIPKVLQNERISFVTLEFVGKGAHILEIQSDFVEQQEEVIETIEILEEKPDNTMIILAAVGIVIAGGAATTAAVYLKRKKA